jgi:hypothetical protein
MRRLVATALLLGLFVTVTIFAGPAAAVGDAAARTVQQHCPQGPAGGGIVASLLGDVLLQPACRDGMTDWLWGLLNV